MKKNLYLICFIALLISTSCLFVIFYFKKNKEIISHVISQNQVIKSEIANVREKLVENSHLVEDLSKYILGQLDYLESRNAELQEIAIDKDKSADSIKEKICRNMIEENTELSEIAAGYDCLAKLIFNKNNDITSFNAIKYQSMALAAFYTPEYMQSLLLYITGSQIKVDWNFDELDLMQRLANSEDKLISSRAKYRLSIINTLGRKLSTGEIKFNLPEAVNLRNEVLQTFNSLNHEKKKVDVLFSLNDNPDYVRYAKTTLASILLNANLETEYNFYFIMDAEDVISPENQNSLDSLHKIGNYNIHFITMPDGIINHNEKAFSQLRVRVSFQKFLVENILKNLDRVITLDVDLIVLRDLYDLQNIDGFNNFVLAGATEPVKYGRNRTCDMTYKYINTGVVVQNLKLMRQINSSEYIMNSYKNEFSIRDQVCFAYRDQDALNIIYKDKFKQISRRWNSIQIGWNDVPLDVDTYPQKMPFIVHFPGAKPSKEDTKRPECILYNAYEDLASLF